MCGIFGILANKEAKVNQETINFMISLIRHRGPDAVGVFISQDLKVGLAHARLSIIDPGANSNQPFISKSKNLILTFNGEIYNYKEIKQYLKVQGYEFITESDTEVIVYAYEHWGEKCVNKFNGMFSFALWNEKKQELFCARDRFGEKPFLYTINNHFFSFASEYKCLLPLLNDFEVDYFQVQGFLLNPSKYSLETSENTIFSGIKQIPPAHYMIINQNLKTRVERYWSPKPDDKLSITYDEAVNEFRDLFHESLKLRTQADVPIGSCLSGGIDSSSIVRTLIKQNIVSKNNFHTFSGRFFKTECDEGEFISLALENLNINHHDVFITGKGFLDDIENYYWHNELPTDSLSQYAQYCVFREASKTGVKVLLDGQGADELLAGYENYFNYYINNVLHSEKREIKKRYPEIFSEIKLHHKLPKEMLKKIAIAINSGTSFSYAIKNSNVFSNKIINHKNLRDALEHDMCFGFLPTLLRYGDRNSMAHSLEVRLPFTDHNIYEFISSVPDEFLLGNAQTKRILRSSMHDILPHNIYSRWRKQGFNPPVADWLIGDLDGLVDETFNSKSFIERSDSWNLKWIKSSRNRFRCGEKNLANTLWKVLAFENWNKYFLNNINIKIKKEALMK